MTNAEFWQLIEATIGHEDRAERLAQLLDSYAPEHLIEFQLHHDDAMQTANTVDLRAACQIIHGQVDEELFSGFREGLIEHGQEPFKRFVADPDSLAGSASPGETVVSSWGFGLLAIQVWTAKTGQDEDAFFTAIDALDTADRGAFETGDMWNFNDREEVTHRLPRLAKKFLGD